jgi:hypothetical protein
MLGDIVRVAEVEELEGYSECVVRVFAAGQNAAQLLWLPTAAPSGYASNIMHRPGNPLPIGDVVENSNVQTQRNTDNLRSVYMSDLQSETQTGDRLDLFTLLNQDAAAPSENTTANNQTNPATPIGRQSSSSKTCSVVERNDF